jgi:hypothetical protein
MPKKGYLFSQKNFLLLENLKIKLPNEAILCIHQRSKKGLI